MSLAPDTSRAQVGFVHGSKPVFADETRQLLRSRLLAAALATSGILAFAFIGNLILGNFLFWWVRLSFLLLLGSGIYALREFQWSFRNLRLFEIVVFGVFCVQLVMMMVARLTKYAVASDIASFAAVKEGYLAAFCVLILAYGIFVPNSWKRGAALIIPMAILPYVVFWILDFSSASVAKAFDSVNYTSPIPLTFMASIVAIYGTHVINRVRREAFKARQLGQYRLGRMLGSGGMGEVYEAEHVLLKRPCAIKLIKPESEADSKSLMAFEKEVKATAKLTHWNTVEVFDYGHTEDGTFYYVMELLPGMSLQEIVDQYGPLPPERVVYLLLQLCDALDEAHHMDLIHRDLKPANIFVSQRGRKHDIAKLLDFGLVKERTTELGSQSAGFSGTPEYMSPEQATAYDQVVAGSDIYSLACAAYFALTGQPPFPSSTVMEALLAHAQQQPRSLLEINPALPEDLDRVLARCLKKDVAERFATAHEFADALSNCVCSGHWNEERAARWWESYPHELEVSHSRPTEKVQLNTLDETFVRDPGN